MTKTETTACWIGLALAGIGIYLLTDPPVLQPSRSRNPTGMKEEESAEELAERLKQAWGDHHTP